MTSPYLFSRVHCSRPYVVQMPKREIVEEGNPETGTVIHEREVRPGLNWAGVIRRAGMVSSELDN